MQYDISKCPVRRAMDILGGKWALLVLHELRDERLRFAELRRGVTGISEKMLTQELRQLCAQGLVLRHDYLEVPPRVDYRLSDLGREALQVVAASAAFGMRLMEVEVPA